MTNESPNRSRRLLTLVGRHAWTALFACSLMLNLVHAQRLRASHAAEIASVREGTMLPPLDLVSSNGRRAQLRYGEHELPTILYFFSPACGWCERNWNNVVALERFTRGRYRFVPLSTTSDVDRLRAAHGITFEVYSGLSEELRRAHGFAGTPHTILVSPNGRVMKAWAGAYNERLSREIEGVFQVRLPGLAPRS
jgi:peroxiredoxin